MNINDNDSVDDIIKRIKNHMAYINDLIDFVKALQNYEGLRDDYRDSSERIIIAIYDELESLVPSIKKKMEGQE